MKLKITKHAELKLKYFIAGTDGEISGLARAQKINDEMVLDEVIIYDQECTGAHTNIDNGAIAKWQYLSEKAGIDTSKFCVWWHSHADMEAFFSTTDTNTIESHNAAPFIVSLVGNKKGNYKARLDYFTNILGERIQATMVLDIIFETLDDPELRKDCEAEIVKKIKIKTYQNDYAKDYPISESYHATEKWRDDWDQNIESEIKQKAELNSGRRFNVYGYDDDGYTVDGFNEDGDYNAGYDDVNI